MKVNYSILNNSLVLNYSGKTVVVDADDKRYDNVLNAIRNSDLESIPGIVEATERAFDGSGLELKDGLVYADGEPIPAELNARILKHKELGLPFDSLTLFWQNLKQNPSYNSRLQLFKFLEHNGHPVTDDGCFIAYRGVTEEFRDKHTGKFDNSPGAVCEEDRALVDDNPNNTCSRGLHVACFDYANGFGPKTVEVKVNPRDVVCVPTDYNGTKMRVCRFEVIAVCDTMRTEAVYGHEQPAEVEDEQETEENDEDTTIRCSECHSEVGYWHNFCPNCGIDLNEEEESDEDSDY